MTGNMNTCNRSQGHSTTVNIRLHELHLFRIRSAFVKCFLFSREHSILQGSVFEIPKCAHALCILLITEFISLYTCIITKDNFIIWKKCHLVQNRPVSPADLANTEECGVLYSLPIDRTLELLRQSSGLTARLWKEPRCLRCLWVGRNKNAYQFIAHLPGPIWLTGRLHLWCELDWHAEISSLRDPNLLQYYVWCST
jgi:hypothetical protein